MSNKTLIAYFSHDGEAYLNGQITELETGNTKVAADIIRKLTGGYVFRIVPEKPYPHEYMDTVEIAKSEQQEKERPILKSSSLNIVQYDTIILGYPNWWGTMPMAVFSFLENYDFFGKRILPFCTHEGSGLGHSVDDIRRICVGARVEKGLAITGGKVQSAEKDIKTWLYESEL